MFDIAGFEWVLVCIKFTLVKPKTLSGYRLPAVSKQQHVTSNATFEKLRHKLTKYI
jgi:hypothetical protein